MAKYVLLMKLTDQGIKDVKNAPKRIEAAAKFLEGMGGKLIDFYAVLGDYDYVAIGEVPTDEAGLTFLLGLGGQGNVRTTTLKAFSRDEFAEIVGRM